MKLLAISSPVFFPEEAKVINNLFHAGLSCLHLRKPDAKKEDFCKLLAEIDVGFRDRISLHQHHELANVFELKRLHFTEFARKTMSNDTLKALDEQGYVLSTSVHELCEVNLISTFFNYTFFSPVFDSISKPGYKGVMNEDIVLYKTSIKIPVIALGGINVSNLKKVKKMNFDGAAILGALWENPTKAVQVFSEINRENSR